jgi:anti-anti-sigma factor
MNDPVTKHQCQIDVEHAGPVRVVRVRGRLDWATAASFRDRLRDEWTSGPLVIDLGGASGMDSSGTGVVLAAVARAQRRGQPLVLVSLDPILKEVLSSPSLGLSVPIVGSCAAALHLLHEPDRQVTSSGNSGAARHGSL